MISYTAFGIFTWHCFVSLSPVSVDAAQPVEYALSIRWNTEMAGLLDRVKRHGILAKWNLSIARKMVYTYRKRWWLSRIKKLFRFFKINLELSWILAILTIHTLYAFCVFTEHLEQQNACNVHNTQNKISKILKVQKI